MASPSQARPKAHSKPLTREEKGLGQDTHFLDTCIVMLDLTLLEREGKCQGDNRDHIVENLKPGSQDTMPRQSNYLMTIKTTITLFTDYLYLCRLPSYTQGLILARFSYRPLV